MPIYAYRCLKKTCGHGFEVVTFNLKEAKPDSPKCPACKGKRSEAVFSVPSYPMFTNPNGTSREEDWDYKHAWNLEMAQRQRKINEKKFGQYAAPVDNTDLNDARNYDVK